MERRIASIARWYHFGTILPFSNLRSSDFQCLLGRTPNPRHERGRRAFRVKNERANTAVCLLSLKRNLEVEEKQLAITNTERNHENRTENFRGNLHFYHRYFRSKTLLPSAKFLQLLSSPKPKIERKGNRRFLSPSPISITLLTLTKLTVLCYNTECSELIEAISKLL